jgi:hypothetical protein
MHPNDRGGVVARIEQDDFFDQILLRYGSRVTVERSLEAERGMGVEPARSTASAAAAAIPPFGG